MQSINPFNQEKLFDFNELSLSEASERIDFCDKAYLSYKSFDLADRSKLLYKLADLLESQKENLARTITLEMGKLLKEAVAEIEKCAWVCRYYAENASGFLATKKITLDKGERAEVHYEPLGVLLIIMPWNFPFWQVFRVAAPAMMLGNGIVLKHASNVQKCGELMEDLFRQAGFPESLFINLPVSGKKASELISHNKIKAVSLTGSAAAGKKVAATAGKELKKCVLELGGTNALIVLEDADIDLAVKKAIAGRFLNAGQSCIASKRFLIHEKIYEVFMGKFKSEVNALKTGNPLEKVDLGPLAQESFAEELQKQIDESLKMGAHIVCGGTHQKALFEPTIIDNVSMEMPVFKEETFGPCAAVMKISSLDEAIKISNESNYGLGVSVFTQNLSRIRKEVNRFEEGAVFINSFVKSDPRLPFGGVKNSGYGRELSLEGILEFANIKTVHFT